MGVKITGTYLGNKRTELTHEDSGATIRTSAPKDNQGDGSSFSPTDLFSGSLGACMMTIMGILGERDKVDLSGSHFSVIKEMTEAPRRVKSLTVEFHLPKALPPEYRKKLEVAAHTCPVHRSLDPQVTVTTTFIYSV